MNAAYEWLYSNLPVEFQTERLLKYHASIASDEYRSNIVRKFAERGGDISIVGATTASLGKGIDKPDVRAVFVWGATRDLEDYIQAIGRAGRDMKYGLAMTFMYYFYPQVRMCI